MAERPSRSSKRAPRDGSTPRKPTSRPAAAKKTSRASATKTGATKTSPKKTSPKKTGAKKTGVKQAPARPRARSARGVEAAPAAEVALTAEQTAQMVEERLASAVPAAASGTLPRADRKDAALVRAWAVDLARLCRDDKCEDVAVLDLSAMQKDYDYIVVASGTSDRQMRSVLRHLEELGGQRGWPAFRVNIDDRATWLIADFLDIVVHLFEPATRSHYDLEMLWGDAPRVEWERADQVDRDRARLTR